MLTNKETVDVMSKNGFTYNTIRLSGGGVIVFGGRGAKGGSEEWEVCGMKYGDKVYDVPENKTLEELEEWIALVILGALV